MNRVFKTVWTATMLAGAAGTALAQPRVVIIGDGATVLSISNDGTTATGTQGSSPVRWAIGANSLTMTAMTSPGTGGGISSASDDGAYVIGSVPNTSNLGNLGATQQMAGRWTASTNTWANLGLMTPNAALGVTGSGQSGNIHSVRDISATGRFVVGQGYIAPNNSFRYRGWVWDSQAQSGAGEMVVLPTSFNTTANRYRDGRALAVSADGAVIVGGEDPSSSGRAIVYRFNSGTNSYDWSYLPEGVDGSGNPILHSIDSLYINPAGTIIVGSSWQWNSTISQPERYLTKWTWNSGTSTWDRTLLYNENSQMDISSWWVNPGCAIPPDFTVTAISDDATTIVGILRYSTCSGFVRSGFIWTAGDGGTMTDFYDYMVAAGANMSQFASTGVNIPPSCGYPLDISGDARFIVGAGTPVQSSPGPGYFIDMAPTTTDCIQPFLTSNPAATATYNRCSSITLSCGAGGSPTLSYQWYKNGNPIGDTNSASSPFIFGSTTNRLFVGNVTPNEVGTYFCVVTGPCGSPLQTTSCVVSLDANGAAAPNDTCASAQSVVMGTNVLSPAQGVCGAWVDDGYPSCGGTSKYDRWYVWTPTFTGDARIETCGSNIDTVLTAYEGSCTGNEIGCNDNRDAGPSSCSSTRSRISRMPVTNGVPVYLRVAASPNASISTGSTYNLSISQAPNLPANDNCDGAANAAVGANPFDLTEATPDGLFPSCMATTGTNSDVWFRFAPDCDGEFTIQTCGSSISDPILTVYDACNGSEIACNNNVGSGQTGCSSNQARVTGLNIFGTSPVLIRVAASGNTLPSSQTGTLTIIKTNCITDYTQDGNSDQDDVAYLISVIAGAENTTGVSPDFTCDGNADQDDVTALINRIGGGACP